MISFPSRGPRVCDRTCRAERRDPARTPPPPLGPRQTPQRRLDRSPLSEVSELAAPWLPAATPQVQGHSAGNALRGIPSPDCTKTVVPVSIKYDQQSKTDSLPDTRRHRGSCRSRLCLPARLSPRYAGCLATAMGGQAGGFLYHRWTYRPGGEVGGEYAGSQELPGTWAFLALIPNPCCKPLSCSPMICGAAG